MGVFERPAGSGVYWILYYDIHGQRHREKAGTLTQARDLLALRQGEKLQGKLPSLARDRLTLAQLVERYAPENRASKKSWKGDLVHAREWVAALGGRDIRDIKPGDIEAQKGRWLSDLAPATINARLAYLKTLFNRALRDDLVERTPLGAKRVKMLREPPPRDRLITPEEEALLLEHFHPAFRRAVFVGLYTGLRQAEQFKALRQDVNLARGQLRIQDERGRTKGGSRQHLDLSPRVVEVLREQLASHRSRWVWPADDLRRVEVVYDEERPLAGDTALDRLTAAATALKLPEGVLWHTLRHTYISRLCMLGVPLPTVQRLARHKSLAMTMRYAHLCPDHTRQALVLLDGFAPDL